MGFACRGQAQSVGVWEAVERRCRSLKRRRESPSRAGGCGSAQGAAPALCRGPRAAVWNMMAVACKFSVFSKSRMLPSVTAAN